MVIGALPLYGICVMSTPNAMLSSAQGRCVPEPTPAHNEPQDIPLTIVFEDDHLLVVDKPAGLVVHPGAGRPTGTLVHALLGALRAFHQAAERLTGLIEGLV